MSSDILIWLLLLAAPGYIIIVFFIWMYENYKQRISTNNVVVRYPKLYVVKE